jgi:CheY-like chemotaxis protein
MKTHILFVDHHVDDLRLFSGALSDVGIPNKCTYAQNALYALQLLEFITPDIIVMEINMPLMSGLECLVQIRKNPKLESATVILFSNTVSAKLEQEVMQAGASWCVPKPRSVQGFTRLLTRALSPDLTDKIHSTSGQSMPSAFLIGATGLIHTGNLALR